MNNPLVSVIIPSYNVAAYLSDACDSLLAQTYDNWEAIIVDDGSTKDNTAEIAKKYCQKDDRFKYIYQENKGLSGARKTGIDVAKGEYIQLLDADDALMPDRLTDMVTTISQMEKNVVLYSDFRIGLNDSLKGEIIDSIRPFSINRDLNFKDMYLKWRFKFLFVPACVFFPAKLFSEIEYDETLRSVEDFDLYLGVLDKGYVLRPYNKKNILYRDNPSGLSKNKTFIYSQLFSILLKWKKNINDYCKVIANLYSEIIIEHFWKKRTDLIQPLKKDNFLLFYFYTFYFLVKRLFKILFMGIKNNIK